MFELPDRFVEVDDDDYESGVHARDLISHVGEQQVGIDPSSIPVYLKE
jgi:hypothetical protein